MSLARLWQREGPTKARRLLTPVVRRFTRGSSRRTWYPLGPSSKHWPKSPTATETLHRAYGMRVHSTPMGAGAEDPSSIEFGRFRVDRRARQLLADGHPVELGGRAFDTLLVLI